MQNPSQTRGANNSNAAALSSAAAALKGATLAFQKTGTSTTERSVPASPNPPPPNNGALRAANQAQGAVSRQTTGGSTATHGGGGGGGGGGQSTLDHGLVLRRLSQHLSPSPSSQAGGGNPSASYIAATLAASRSGSPSPSPRPSPAPLPAAQVHSRVMSRPSFEDGAGIGTGSLVAMFEGREDGEDVDVDPVKRRDVSPSERASRGTLPEVRVRAATFKGGDEARVGRSPRPRVTREGRQVGDGNGNGEVKSKPPVAPRKPTSLPGGPEGKRPVTPPPPTSPLPLPLHDGRRTTDLVSPEPRRIIKTPRLDPPQVPPRIPTTKSETDLEHLDDREPTTRRASHSSVSSNDTFVSASSTQSPRPSSPVKASPPAKPPPRQNPSPNSSALALNSLTNAILASNIASSRMSLSSPTPPPIPAPRRHGRTTEPSTSRSPPKQKTGMLQTLRAAPTSHSDDEDARRRTHRTRKKPRHPLSGAKKHMHNEGARKRWRDEVSARERRRYEAVWASNRGLFLRNGWGFTRIEHDDGKAEEGTEEADLVVNVVVRDIWGRSRLPEDELGEVWELVDRRRDGTLGREEFVVGMWLIDQRLRGRKIPARVGDSVWGSVRGFVIKEPRTRR
ncbi:hypothetical protein OQA88_566 [Cercophora sp. LCS_1]